MSGMLALAASRVVYVSCDAATLARDVKRFAEVGYSLEHIEAFDLFPNTAHIETLAVRANSVTCCRLIAVCLSLPCRLSTARDR